MNDLKDIMSPSPIFRGSKGPNYKANRSTIVSLKLDVLDIPFYFLASFENAVILKYQ